jgi:hypothetical protein
VDVVLISLRYIPGTITDESYINSLFNLLRNNVTFSKETHEELQFVILVPLLWRASENKQHFITTPRILGLLAALFLGHAQSFQCPLGQVLIPNSILLLSPHDNILLRFPHFFCVQTHRIII